MLPLLVDVSTLYQPCMPYQHRVALVGVRATEVIVDCAGTPPGELVAGWYISPAYEEVPGIPPRLMEARRPVAAVQILERWRALAEMFVFIGTFWGRFFIGFPLWPASILRARPALRNPGGRALVFRQFVLTICGHILDTPRCADSPEHLLPKAHRILRSEFTVLTDHSSSGQDRAAGEGEWGAPRHRLGN